MTHDELVNRAVKWLRSQRCRVIAWERNTNTYEQPDAIGWGALGNSILVECKASRADFFRDVKKSFRKHPSLGMGSWRFYMTPPGLVKSNEVPYGWGLLECGPRSVKKILPATHHIERHRLNEIVQLVRIATGKPNELLRAEAAEAEVKRLQSQIDGLRGRAAGRTQTNAVAPEVLIVNRGEGEK